METKSYDIEDYLYTKESKVAGEGLFTSKSFKKGDTVFVMKGPKVNFYPKNKEEALELPNIVGLEKDLYIDPIYPYVKINHKCEPNLAVQEDGVSYVAIQDIEKDDELTFDYSISEYSDWEMPCNCGSENCRKLIQSVDKLPPKFFREYFPNIPNFFQKKFIERYIKEHE